MRTPPKAKPLFFTPQKRKGTFSAVGLKCRSQATGQVTGHRSQVTGPVTGHKPQVRSQVTQKNNRTLDKTVLD